MKGDTLHIPEYPVFQVPMPRKKRFAKLQMLIEVAEEFDNNNDIENTHDILQVLIKEINRQIESDADRK